MFSARSLLLVALGMLVPLSVEAQQLETKAPLDGIVCRSKEPAVRLASYLRRLQSASNLSGTPEEYVYRRMLLYRGLAHPYSFRAYEPFVRGPREDEHWCELLSADPEEYEVLLEGDDIEWIDINFAWSKEYPGSPVLGDGYYVKPVSEKTRFPKACADCGKAQFSRGYTTDLLQKAIEGIRLDFDKFRQPE